MSLASFSAVSLAPSRPFSGPVFPLRHETFASLDTVAGRASDLPTHVDALVDAHGIAGHLADKHNDHLTEVAQVYGISKQHTESHKENIAGLGSDFASDLITLCKDSEVLYPKIQAAMKSKNKQAVHEIVRKLDLDLRALILKVAGIVDSFDRAEKTVQLGHKHVCRVHDGAPDNLLKHKSHEDDLNLINKLFEPAIQTLLTVQGGCARTLANLSVLEDEVEKGVFDLYSIITDKSIDDVVRAWADLRKRTEEYRDWNDDR